MSKSAFFEEVGHYQHKFKTKGVLPTNHCWCQKTSDCSFVWYLNIHSAQFGFVTKHACDRQTDGRTNRWTELRLPKPY